MFGAQIRKECVWGRSKTCAAAHAARSRTQRGRARTQLRGNIVRYSNICYLYLADCFLCQNAHLELLASSVQYLLKRLSICTAHRHANAPLMRFFVTDHRRQRDGWLSWPCWLTDSGRFTHRVVTRLAISLAQDRESSPARTGGLTTMLRDQLLSYATNLSVVWCDWWLITKEQNSSFDDQSVVCSVGNRHLLVCGQSSVSVQNRIAIPRLFSVMEQFFICIFSLQNILTI